MRDLAESLRTGVDQLNENLVIRRPDRGPRRGGERSYGQNGIRLKLPQLRSRILRQQPARLALSLRRGSYRDDQCTRVRVSILGRIVRTQRISELPLMPRLG